ncbi:MAG: DUF6067 family protein [Gemmatimonadota bacterium]|nr:DUF6067 family protein [Gemmatimonadota bacterium]
MTLHSRRQLAIRGALVAALFQTAAIAAQPRPRDVQAVISYGTARWNADSLGNHRVLVHVDATADAVQLHIPWRRRDESPELKKIVVLDASTGARVMNVTRISVTREAGDLVFQPGGASLDYAVYFMPYRRTNRSANYPRIAYPPPDSTADSAWLRRNRLGEADREAETWRSLPRAQVVAFESADSLDVFTAMEIIATSEETRDLVARNPDAPFLVFPEDRANAIRMTSDLPERWIRAGANAPFHGVARRGEFYVFQVGLYAARQPLSDVAVRFSPLRTDGGAVIPPSAMRSINTGGVGWSGEPFRKRISVARGRVQPLWIGVDVPVGARAGDYHGVMTVVTREGSSPGTAITLHVEEHSVAAHGDDDPARLSRLRWLDSRVAHDDGIVPPYTAVTRRGHTIRILGRSVTVGDDGLPTRIGSRFTDGNTRIGAAERDILSAPIALSVDRDRAAAPWKHGGLRFTGRPPGAMQWQVISTSGALTMLTRARLEFDGDIEYQVALSASRAVDVGDIRLEVPYARDVARYLMGLGQKGGERSSDVHWKWDVKKNQDAVWIGDVTAGMQVSLRDERYVRPLNTNFYQLKPLVIPASWSNSGRGGCDVANRDPGATLLRCYSGPRTISPGAPLRYDFRLLVTPFRALDTREHFTNRYFHIFAPVDSAARMGANVINVHHRTAINPYLNYPFLRPEAMKSYIDQAHGRGMKVKIYYTVRELTNHAPEIFALKSLGDEILSSGPGGGPSWLQEHFGSDYIAGWFVPEIGDATVVTSGVSRWHNAYVEGMDWLARNVGVDGIYLDDVAFDRITMQRVRKVLDRRRRGALIDLHSATQFNPLDGFASSANLYLEHFPYLDRLWFGEGFDYQRTPPDYWLVEMSGIPFGLMGEMLEGGGNPWRGMVFGMSNRLYNDDAAYRGDPRAIWKLWDDFGIAESRMVGYWNPRAIVSTGRSDVLATIYRRPARALVAVASWAPDSVRVRLSINWHALGLDSATAVLIAPAVPGFQDAATYDPGAAIPLSPGKGVLLLLRPRRP